MSRTAVDLDVSWLVPADLDAVDALARLQVAAARRAATLQRVDEAEPPPPGGR